MAGYAEQKAARSGGLASPSLVKIMRITGLDRRFLGSRASVLDGKIPGILHVNAVAPGII